MAESEPNAALRDAVDKCTLSMAASNLVAVPAKLRQLGCQTAAELDTLFDEMKKTSGDMILLRRIQVQFMHFASSQGGQCGSNTQGLAAMGVIGVMTAIRPDITATQTSVLRVLVQGYLQKYGAKVTHTANTNSKWDDLLLVIAADIEVLFGLMFPKGAVDLRLHAQKIAADQIRGVRAVVVVVAVFLRLGEEVFMLTSADLLLPFAPTVAMGPTPPEHAGRMKSLGKQLVQVSVDDAVTNLLQMLPDLHLGTMLSLDRSYGPLLQLLSASVGRWHETDRRSTRGAVTLRLLLVNTARDIAGFAKDKWPDLTNDSRHRVKTFFKRVNRAADWGDVVVASFAACHDGAELRKSATFALSGLTDAHPDRFARAAAISALQAGQDLSNQVTGARQNPSPAQYCVWLAEYLRRGGKTEDGPWTGWSAGVATVYQGGGAGVMAFMAAQSAGDGNDAPAPNEVILVVDSDDEDDDEEILVVDSDDEDDDEETDPKRRRL